MTAEKVGQSLWGPCQKAPTSRDPAPVAPLLMPPLVLGTDGIETGSCERSPSSAGSESRTSITATINTGIELTFQSRPEVARAMSNLSSSDICIVVLSCLISIRCCSCCLNTCSYYFSVVGARKGGAPRDIDLRIESVPRIDTCHGSNLYSYFYDGTLSSSNLCWWYCCPPLLPFLHQLQWFRARSNVSITANTRVHLIRWFELCGPVVVALPLAPSRAR
jgi:hypothetical protein